MSVDFDKSLFFGNISYLLAASGKKIGELETEAGVSLGYISRTSKDSNSKPGIDFIMKVSDSLNVSMDTLLHVDISELTPTEKYIVSFFEKLERDTVDDKLHWGRESESELNRLDFNKQEWDFYPLFSEETFYEQGETEYPDLVTRVVFKSNSFDVHTAVNGDCYNLRLKNGAILFLMNICKSVHYSNDLSAYAKEAWMCMPDGTLNFICSNKESSLASKKLELLYSVVSESAKHPKIEKKMQYIIDAFMNDDIEDDPGATSFDQMDNLPFN